MSNGSRYSEFFMDGVDRRIRLWNEMNKVLTKMLDDLPSNYISTIPSPNYAIFQKSVAEESGLYRITDDDVKQDGYYVDTRASFLYQILGYLLHDTQVASFSPPGYTDEQYRRFLLALVVALFGGSRPRNIEEATQIFTQLPVSVVEIFKLIAPYGTSTRFDISDQFGWFFEIDVPELGPFDLSGIEGGLNFIAKVMKPAHTWYELRLIYRDTYYTTGHCITLLGSVGYLKAWRIVVDRTAGNDPTPIDGVIDNFVDGEITWIGDPNLKVGHNVRVKTDANTEIKDEFGHVLTFNDLVVGDRVYIDGLIVDAPIGDDGFYHNLKVTPTAICDKVKLDYFDYAYDDSRICCEDLRQLEQIVDEDITGKNCVLNAYPPARVFYTKFGPFTNAAGEITFDVDDVVVKVNGVAVVVDRIFPHQGAILLAVAPLAGATVTVSYYYFENPYTDVILNEFGSLLNDYNNPVIGRLPQNSVLYPAPFTTCDPIEITYNYKGFELKYSSVLNDNIRFSLLLNDTSRLNVNGSTLNHYNVIDSRSPIVKYNAQWVGPPDIHFLGSSSTLPPDTPLMKLTMDIINAQIEYQIIPDDSDVLNSLTDLLNSMTLPFRLNYVSYNIINDFRYAIYSCMSEFLETEVSGTGGYLSAGCDQLVGISFGGDAFSDTYSGMAEVSCGISLQPFELNDTDSHLNENDNERDRMGPIGVLLLGP